MFLWFFSYDKFKQIFVNYAKTVVKPILNSLSSGLFVLSSRRNKVIALKHRVKQVMRIFTFSGRVISDVLN